MAKIQDLALGRADQYKIDPRLIEIEPGYNVRLFDSANDEEDLALKNSIRENGVRQPITVRMVNDVIFVGAGHRRLSAVKELIAEGHNIVSVPAVSEARYATAADRDLDLLTSNQGKPLTALEKSEVFKRLINTHGWSEDQVATKAGITTKQVQNLLLLSGATPEIKEMISTHVVSATQAIQTMKTEGSQATAVLTEARKVATAAGKTKITAATMKPKAKEKAPDPTNPTTFATAGVLASLGVTSPTPEVQAPRVPRMIKTDAKFQEFYDTLQEILKVDDINSIHCMVRDVLFVKGRDAA